ncbi:hypothetical protein ES705_25549 [subsurface metagenome]
MNYGLKQRDLDYLIKALEQFPEIEIAIIFGSRAKGNYKPASDLDIVVKGERIADNTILKLLDLLEEELPLPYFIDVLHYEKINNKELKEHIDRMGKVFYSKAHV